MHKIFFLSEKTKCKAEKASGPWRWRCFVGIPCKKRLLAHIHAYSGARAWAEGDTYATPSGRTRPMVDGPPSQLSRLRTNSMTEVWRSVPSSHSICRFHSVKPLHIHTIQYYSILFYEMDKVTDMVGGWRERLKVV